jgi:tetratricopeptide (TPR) repeat protein
MILLSWIPVFAGYSYRHEHEAECLFGGMVGNAPAGCVAGTFGILGGIALFLVGLGVLIAGLVRGSTSRNQWGALDSPSRNSVVLPTDQSATDAQTTISSQPPEVVARIETLEARISEDPQNVALALEYASFLASRLMHRQALVQFFKILERDGSNLAAKRGIVDILKRTGEFGRASDILHEMIRLEPQSAELRRELIEVLLLAGKHEGLDDEIQGLVSTTGGDVESLTQARDLVVRLGLIPELIPVCQEFVKRVPEDCTTWSLLASALLHEGRREEALDAFRHLLALAPRNARSALYLGVAAHDAAASNSGEGMPQACAFLEGAVQCADELDQAEIFRARLYLASAHMRLSRLDDADTETLIRLDTRNIHDEDRGVAAEILARLGDLQRDSGAHDAALRSYRLSLSLSDLHPVRERVAQLHIARGNDLLRGGRFAEAKAEAVLAEQVLPSNEQIADLGRAAATGLKGRRNRKLVLVMAVALLLLTVWAFFYFGQGIVEVQVTPAPQGAKLDHDGIEIDVPHVQAPRSDAIDDRDRVPVRSVMHEPRITLSKKGNALLDVLGYNFRTPLLRVGTYLVHVEQKYRKTTDQDVHIGFGRGIVTVVIDPEPNFGGIKVESDPKGATITINKVQTGKVTPFLFTPVEPGSALIGLGGVEGYEDIEEQVSVRNGETAAVALQLTPSMGTLAIVAENLDGTPCISDLRIDGTTVGRTPWEGVVHAVRHSFDVTCGLDHVFAEGTVVQDRKNRAVIRVPRSVVAASIEGMNYPSSHESDKLVSIMIGDVETFALSGKEYQAARDLNHGRFPATDVSRFFHCGENLVHLIGHVPRTQWGYEYLDATFILTANGTDVLRKRRESLHEGPFDEKVTVTVPCRIQLGRLETH